MQIKHKPVEYHGTQVMYHDEPERNRHQNVLGRQSESDDRNLLYVRDMKQRPKSEQLDQSQKMHLIQMLNDFRLLAEIENNEAK